ncbi:DUF4239 domain-containing protein [Streptomyces sp. A7024]|uniref:DUF4239 domain-containing protein n=1 Tax=Streptomyces coryli TaxID=1128680 RepID=A0A6G4U0Z9_9ACTN|nr:DUF4239 domain-containing protein [Streptomyces coryli]NGN64957.1 DUF4239 domain-containing protein [Streptomyces coryli]
MRYHNLGVFWLLFTVAAVGLVVVRTVTIGLWVEAALTVAFTLLLVNSGVPLARRLVRNALVERNSPSQGAVFASIGAVFATLVAFAVVVVWEHYAETQTTVAQEANALANIERLSRGFPVEKRRQVQEATRTYAYVVVDAEWKNMAEHGPDPRAQSQLGDIWSVYMNVKPADRDDPLYEASVANLQELSDNRRLRLLAAEYRVPGVVWILLYFGGVVTIVMVYFFGVRRDWMQRVVVSVGALVIALSIFLVSALENPFKGEVAIQPDAFTHVVDQMQNLER